MECKYCKANWEGELDVYVCPFCGEDLREERDPSRKTPDFNFTWGLIHADTLRKSRGPVNLSLRDQALIFFVKSCQENPENAVYTSAFLCQYPDPSENLLALDQQYLEPWMVWKDMDPAESLTLSLLCWAMKKQDIAAGLRFFWLLTQENLTPADTETLAVHLMEDWQHAGQGLSDIVQAAFLACENRPVSAGRILASAARGKKLKIFSWKEMERYTGIPGDPEGRIQFVKEAAEHVSQNGLEPVLEGLYRPLQNPDRLFDHLPLLTEEIVPVLKENQADWIEITMHMLKNEQMLRGIHLVLQQIKNSHPELESQLEPLLKLHYEKVYMKSYDWIGATDFAIRAD